ncbi:MAG TPA: proton-conducting transporter membrane subunit [Ignavibacteriales bacterium]|nr:proton-conducting transporter membrane subunit [Ignavibacteriales bacterium]
MILNLFASGLLIQLLGALLPLLIKSDKRYSALSHYTAIAGVSVSFIGTLGMIFFQSPGIINIFENSVWGILSLRFDMLALFFTAVVQLLSIPVLVYSLSYQKPYIEAGKSIRLSVFSFITLTISLQVLTIANHAVLFLMFWELMAILSYINMIFENEKPEVEKGSFVYFVATHAATFVLYIFFLILHSKTGSWNFSDFHITNDGTALYYVLFALGFIGFGTKAGFMPFHFWLPKAHPVAPTYLSAFLSGVIIKLGIYGIFRVIEFLSPNDPIIGWAVLLISLMSAIFGVWYALAQHDVKTLLAYHSIENIGIIGMGLGLGILGISYNNQVVAILGFSGALLHTLNHAIFKSQLFIGSGIIYQNLHTRNIEKMGGIVHYAPWLTGFFLIGSVAISGIPPLNGFISEFIIYNGLFHSGSMAPYYTIFMLLVVVGLALVGGLAVACFTKVNSIMFLGTQRTEFKKFTVSAAEYFSIGLPALLCILIGVYPMPAVRLVSGVVEGLRFNSFRLASQGTSFYMLPDFFPIMVIFVLLFLMAGIFYGIKKYRASKASGVRVSKAWGCGYQHLTARMQYTASSYADELNSIPANILLIKEHARVPQDIFPVRGACFESHSEDYTEKKLMMPVYEKIVSVLKRVGILNRHDIRVYIAYMLVALVAYCIIGFLWKY